MLPTLPGPDSTIGFLREGYTFISRRCDRLGTDGFRTRLVGRPVTCLRGAEAAAMFYGGGRFTRVGAMPPTVVHLLQDEGSVQTLHDEDHRQRKEMFLGPLQGAAAARLPEVFAHEWSQALSRWQAADEVVLHEEMTEVLTRTGASWCGIPADELDATRRTRELAGMVSRAGSFGPANWAAQMARRRTEAWAADLVSRVRAGELAPPEGSFLRVLADHEDLGGDRLEPGTAAVELLNVLRPVVAVSRFVVFAAHALLRHPRWREQLASGDETDLRPFVQEVRRLYPFFPVIGGRAREAFEWYGHPFAAEDWVLLDLYGTNHDPRAWEHPEAFLPERFRGWTGHPESLVPQGAGRYEDDHRCPGEPATIALMEEAVRQLTRRMHYRVPAQDLTIDLRRMPALPRDGFVIREVSG